MIRNRHVYIVLRDNINRDDWNERSLFQDELVVSGSNIDDTGHRIQYLPYRIYMKINEVEKVGLDKKSDVSMRALVFAEITFAKKSNDALTLEQITKAINNNADKKSVRNACNNLVRDKKIKRKYIKGGSKSIAYFYI